MNYSLQKHIRGILGGHYYLVTENSNMRNDTFELYKLLKSVSNQTDIYRCLGKHVCHNITTQINPVLLQT